MRKRVLKKAERLELPVNDYVADQLIKPGEGEVFLYYFMLLKKQ